MHILIFKVPGKIISSQPGATRGAPQWRYCSHALANSAANCLEISLCDGTQSYIACTGRAQFQENGILEWRNITSEACWKTQINFV